MSGAPALSGVVGAALTPFAPGGGVDWEALARQVDFLVPDVDAVALGAVEAAEYTLLSPEQRRELLRRGTEMVAGRVPVIVGASAPTVGEVLDLAELAAEGGADLVQVLMPARPWGGQPTTAELVRWFTAVDERCPLPIVGYHNPAPGAGADPGVEAWLRLAEIPGVRYFKESSRDMTKIARLITELADRGVGYFTTMQPLYASLALGGAGATMPPPATRVARRVVDAFRAGDHAGAMAAQRVFSVFPGRWAGAGLTPVMKAAMAHVGCPLGPAGWPADGLSPEEDARLRSHLEEAGLC